MFFLCHLQSPFTLKSINENDLALKPKRFHFLMSKLLLLKKLSFLQLKSTDKSLE